MTGMVGLAHNKAATNRPITKIDDLWDPAFRARSACCRTPRTAWA